MIKTLSVMLLASSVGAIAQSAQQKIVDMSVLVGGFVSQGGKMKPVTVSGGVVLDARHVLTASSCCGKTEQGQPKVPVVLQGKEVIVGQPVWNGPGFYVIVETEKPLQSGGPVTFAPEKVMRENQPAYTVDFPKNSDPTILETKILGTFTSDSKIDSYKAQPAPESVYMGGGLFNACGQVMGMNMLVKEGTQFAVVSDHAFAGIEKTGIQANVADSPCGGEQSNSGPPHQGKAKEKQKSGDGDGDEESPGGWRLPKGGEWVGVAIIALILGAALRPATRQQVARAFTTRRQPVPYPQPLPQFYGQVPTPVPIVRPKRPVLHGIAGKYAGASVSLEAGPSVLGRDQSVSNLVFPPESDSVSKRHCTVRWDAGRGVFVLEDLGSTNGTFLANGVRLAPGQPQDLRPGDKFYIGDLRNQFEVRMEE